MYFKKPEEDEVTPRNPMASRRRWRTYNSKKTEEKKTSLKKEEEDSIQKKKECSYKKKTPIYPYPKINKNHNNKKYNEIFMKRNHMYNKIKNKSV